MTNSNQLLRRYAQEDSEEAFRQIVARYIDLVFSTALRRTNGDVHLAQDVTRTVFIGLGQKARSLQHSLTLGGWLHRHTGFVASTLVRTERRGQEREKFAAEMNQDHSDPIWKPLAPVLDGAIDRLSTTDRTAIVLRFFERSSGNFLPAIVGLSVQSRDHHTRS